MWAEARNTSAIEGKQESSKGEAWRKGTFVLDLGRRQKQVKSAKDVKNIYLSQKVVSAG